MNELDRWWCNLTTERKNRIASKVGGCNVGYPACTSIWLGLTDERKQAIHDHCKPSENLVGVYTSLATANIRSNLHQIAVFRLLSMSQKSHKSFCRSTFLAETPTTSYQRSTFSKGNLDGKRTFIPMLLSTIICPQYLRGVGVCGRFRICPSSLPFPSLFTVTSMRSIILHIITYSEKRDSHIVTLFIRPYAKRPYFMAKSITIVLPYCYS